MRMPSRTTSSGDRFLHAIRHFARHASARPLATLDSLDPSLSQEQTMGKYVLGWFLGVPLIVLVAIYFIAH